MEVGWAGGGGAGRIQGGDRDGEEEELLSRQASRCRSQ